MLSVIGAMQGTMSRECGGVSSIYQYAQQILLLILESLQVMQQEEADDYVLATGEMHSVREFVEKSFAIVGITIQWQGKDVEEVGLDAQSGKTIVRIDRAYGIW